MRWDETYKFPQCRRLAQSSFASVKVAIFQENEYHQTSTVADPVVSSSQEVSFGFRSGNPHVEATGVLLT